MNTKDILKNNQTSQTQQVSDPVSHPSHYTDGSIEVMDYIADKGLAEGFCKGNVIKYVSRAGKKQSSDLDTNHKAIQDLEKARWYLDYLINYYKKKVEE